MCSRYSLVSPMELLAELFFLTDLPAGDLPPRYNVAPTQLVPVVLGGPRRLRRLRWGLIPPWAKDARVGSRMINARSETAADKPAFRNALRRRRCLVPADGFYEWEKAGRKRLPWLFRRPDGRPFSFAGIWETWRPPEGEPVHSFSILTGQPNAVVAPVHDRMPSILRRADWDAWLSRDLPVPEALPELLRPYPAEELEAHRVSEVVNSPRNEGPQCQERVEGQLTKGVPLELFPGE